MNTAWTLCADTRDRPRDGSCAEPAALCRRCGRALSDRAPHVRRLSILQAHEPREVVFHFCRPCGNSFGSYQALEAYVRSFLLG